MRSRRLPGFRFEVQSPPPTDVLPRMDVACFVGFAASGPLHRPVRVEDVAQFEMIFGADAALAWDEVRGEAVYAYLAPAVRAFFRNGGRRAWIIRVAGQAQTNHFPLSGLLRVQFDDTDHVTAITPAYAPARSAGSWSDAVRVGVALQARTVALSPVTLQPPVFDALLTSPNELAPGDLLRVTWESGDVLMCAVNTRAPSPVGHGHHRLTCDHAIWFKPAWQHWPMTASGTATPFTTAGASAPLPATIPVTTASPPTPDWPISAQRPQVKINLALPYSDAPQPGTLLRLDLGPDQFWLRVSDLRATAEDGSPPCEGVQVVGQGYWLSAGPVGGPSPIDLAERLSCEFWTRAGLSTDIRLSELAFDLRHDRAWDALPTDLQLYPEMTAAPQRAYAALWQAAANPRFPLAGQASAHTLYVPVALPLIPDVFLPPEAAPDLALTRDGLDTFTAELFLDPDLAEVGVRDLLNEADTLRYQALAPRALQGVHAALNIDEATIIAVPDAVQRGWLYRGAPRPDAAPPSDPIVRPNWWPHPVCAVPPRPVRQPEWQYFLNCDLLSNLIAAPELSHTAPDPLGTFTLMWTEPQPDLIYVLHEATRPDFKDAVEIYRGAASRSVVYGHTPGIYYYRVRAVRGVFTSDWSNGEALTIAPPNRWRLIEAGLYSDAPLLAVQHALLRLCAARGDLFAVLALPEHYRAAEAQQHAQTLTTQASGFFGPEEPRTLSFGALYHPWLMGREENAPDNLRRTPPDGAVCGTLAQRALKRGAWLAPAHEFLKGVVALTPAIERAQWPDLQAAQLNLIRHEPPGFAAMNSDTLSPDEDVRPINVRRLLMLLRRLALRQGATYVFEPNSPAFRRSVQRGFEALLDILFMRGAFAGPTAATSYQVVTDTSVNSPPSVDQGRFIVELRVAPSLPLTFLTIRLVQTGDRTLVTQEQ